MNICCSYEEDGGFGDFVVGNFVEGDFYKLLKVIGVDRGDIVGKGGYVGVNFFLFFEFEFG